MKIFLTGGTGFIGSHFLAIALSAGHEVVALRRTDSSLPAIPLPCQPIWLQGTLSELTAKDLRTCRVVVHLASAGVSPKKVAWQDLVAANVTGSAHLIAVAHEADVPRLVVAGTCHEYGGSAKLYDAIPCNAPLEPLSLYAASKAAAFQLLVTYARVHRLELFYGRIFSAYGEGQFEGNFWPSLRDAALTGHDFPMTMGQQIRDFIPVENVAHQLLAACFREDLRRAEPLVANIGSGQPLTLLEFAQREWKRFGARGQLIPGSLPERPDDVQRLAPQLSSN